MLRIHMLVTIALLWAAPLSAQEPPASSKLGTVRFETSCDAAAQPTFDRAVAFLHSFEFRDATDTFNRVLLADPQCGIAYWGLALSAWGNPFAPGTKSDALLQRGLDAVRIGREVSGKTQRERDFLAAAALLYDDYRATDQVTRVTAYRDAMARLAARYPDDIEASMFSALSMAFSADPGDKSYVTQLEAGRRLEELFARHPDHPGLAHYIIHSYDFPAIAGRALDAAHRYATIAPSLPHALHMPSHTFTRVGSWQESINSNVASAAASEQAGSTTEELHASDYLMYAYLQTGQDRAARALLDRLPAIAARFDPAKPTGAAPVPAGFFALAAIPARYALERGQWAEAARLTSNPSPTPWADAITYFGRALGAARSGDTVTARTQVAELARIRDTLAERKEHYWREQAEIQIRVATAWIALREGRNDAALATMRDAATREDATEKSAVTPGPLAPARELLGEMLHELQQPARALAEFERTLEREPNRFRTLAGAARAAAASGDSATARRYYSRLLELSDRGDAAVRPEIVAARRAVRP